MAPIFPLLRMNYFTSRGKLANLQNQKTKDIPVLAEETIFHSPVQLDMNFLSKLYHQNQLRTYQKNFQTDVTNTKNAYLYIRQLNRLGMYQQVIQLNQTTLNHYWKGYRDSDSNNAIKLEKQIELSSERFKAQIKNQATEQLLSTYFKRRKPSIVSIALYSFLAYVLYNQIFQDVQFRVEDDDKPNIFRRIFGNDNKTEASTQQEKPQDDNRPQKKIDRFINILQGKADVMEEKNIPTRFSDVLGIDEFKEELEEIVDYLKNPKKYLDSGAKLPKGLLLVGSPGTGKTLLARALAGEAHCAFFYKSGAEFDEMFVGVGASRVRELFKKAREKSPSIIFIDEIDSIGGNRKANDPSHSRDTINQILTEMDGFKQHESVIVIGATNFEKSLDPAIKRPGRFDKIINIPLPDVRGREEIFSYYMSKIKYETSIEPGYLARQTAGFSGNLVQQKLGADIQNMVNVAILNAIKNNRKIAESSDFEFSLDRISMGIGRKNMFVTEKDKLLTAYHEGGHALTSLLTDGATPLHKVTILPRGGALGFVINYVRKQTSMIPEKDTLNFTRKGMIASIDVAMGGRAAEELFAGQDEITSGCSSDLQKATELAYLYVKHLGMLDKISLISASDKIKTSEKYDYMIDMEVKQILEDSYLRVKNLLKTNESKLTSLASELMIKETLSAKDVKTLLHL